MFIIGKINSCNDERKQNKELEKLGDRELIIPDNSVFAAADNHHFIAFSSLGDFFVEIRTIWDDGTFGTMPCSLKGAKLYDKVGAYVGYLTVTENGDLFLHTDIDEKLNTTYANPGRKARYKDDSSNAENVGEATHDSTSMIFLPDDRFISLDGVYCLCKTYSCSTYTTVTIGHTDGTGYRDFVLRGSMLFDKDSNKVGYVTINDDGYLNIDMHGSCTSYVCLGSNEARYID